MSKYQDILKTLKVPEGKSTDEAWMELQSKLNNRQPKTKLIAFSWRPMVSVAAAAAIIIGLIILWPNETSKTVSCNAGNQELVTLPDASIAQLNAASTLTFSEDWSNDRTVQLNGQAFFDVRKGSKFQVVTSVGLVEVLGTSFDVFARGADFRVECRTGKVRVTSGNQSVDIVPGFSAVLENGQLLVGEFNMSDADWRSGEFIYEDADLSEIFNELGRQFNMQFETPNIVGRKYTGRFNNKSLDEALQLVCQPMAMRYTILNEQSVRIEDATTVKR